MSAAQQLAIPLANNGNSLAPEIVQFLWQVAMDNICNTCVTDPIEGIDSTILALRVLRDYLPQCVQELA